MFIFLYYVMSFERVPGTAINDAMISNKDIFFRF